MIFDIVARPVNEFTTWFSTSWLGLSMNSRHGFAQLGKNRHEDARSELYQVIDEKFYLLDYNINISVLVKY